MNSRKTLLLASTLVLSVAANAKEEGWSGKVNLGYLATSGNTENSSLNSAFDLEYDSEKWEHLFHMAAIRASENDETTAQAFEASWKSEYSVADDNYVFGRVKWSKDKFSGYDQQVSETVGYGRRILDTDVHQLSAELGIGAAQSDLRDGTSEDDFIGRAAALELLARGFRVFAGVRNDAAAVALREEAPGEARERLETLALDVTAWRSTAFRSMDKPCIGTCEASLETRTG